MATELTKYDDRIRPQGPTKIIVRPNSILFKPLGAVNCTGGDVYWTPDGLEGTIEFFDKGKEDRGRRIHHYPIGIISSGTDFGITVGAKGVLFRIPPKFVPLVHYA